MLYEIEKNQNLSDREKEEIYDYPGNLTNTLNKKEKYQDHDRDDLDYYGIKDIKNLFGNAVVVDHDYYKLILIKSSFKNNYKYYESKRDKDKTLSVKQYLYMIMPYLKDLINNHKSNEWKIQVNMHAILFLLKIQEKLVLFLCEVIPKKLGRVMKQMILLRNFLNLS